MIRETLPLIILATLAYVLMRLSENLPPLALLAYVIIFALVIDLFLYLLIPLVAIAMKMGRSKFLMGWVRDRVVLKPLLYQAVLAYSGTVATAFRLAPLTYLALLHVASTAMTLLVMSRYGRAESRLAKLSLPLALLTYTAHTIAMLSTLGMV